MELELTITISHFFSCSTLNQTSRWARLRSSPRSRTWSIQSACTEYMRSTSSGHHTAPTSARHSACSSGTGASTSGLGAPAARSYWEAGSKEKLTE